MSTKISPECHKAFASKFGTRVRFDEILAPLLAFRVGGPADILVFPKTEEELHWISKAGPIYELPITIVGSGTNLLVLDGGIRGITVALIDAFNQIEKLSSSHGAVLVRSGGGVSKAGLLEWALQESLTGLEFSAGVPGTIGGGISMNAGTKYGCYGDILTRLKLFDFVNGAQEIQRNHVDFGYRTQNAVQNQLVLHATFRLTSGNSEKMRGQVASIIAERSSKQPLDYPSCGSTFKNPPDHSAGRLIEKVGLKGLSVGGAEISQKHANFILNKGTASSSDILTLIDIIKERVFSVFGVRLDCEVIVLGENC